MNVPREGSSEPTVEGEYQEALVWTTNARVNWYTTDRAETSLVGRVGQVRLNSESLLVDRGGQSVIAIPVNNEAGRTEEFWEVGVEFNLYDNPLEVLHAEGGLLNPLFHVSAGLKRDARFKKAGPVAEFDVPEQRLFFRFLIDALKITDERPLAKEKKIFTLGFGVEYERALKGDKKVPSGTKILLRGDFDLLRVIRGCG